MVLAHRHGAPGDVKEAGERAIRVQPLSKSGCHLYTTWSPPVSPPQTLGTQRSAGRQLATFALLLFVLSCSALLCSSWHSFAFPYLLFSAVLTSDCFAFSLLEMLCFSLCYFALLCFALLCFAFSFLGLLRFYLCGHALFFISLLRVPVSALLYLLCSSVPFLALLCFALTQTAFFPWLSLSWHRFVFPRAPFLSFAVFMNA